MNDFLTQKEKQDLLKLARIAIEYFVKHRQNISINDTGICITENMKKEYGAFVTLHLNGELRGCIGEIIAHGPLFEAITRRAIDAAIHDPRFPPVQTDELPFLDIEISILSPLQAISHYKEIEIGKHGIYMSKLGRGAVFLPHVASEQGWDLATTLTHLSLKAGLPPDAWEAGASFEIFESLICRE